MLNKKLGLSFALSAFPLIAALPAEAAVSSFFSVGSVAESPTPYSEVTKLRLDSDYYFGSNIDYENSKPLIAYFLETLTNDAQGVTHVMGTGILEEYVGDPRVANDCSAGENSTTDPVLRCDSPNVIKSLFTLSWHPSSGEGYTIEAKERIAVATNNNAFTFIGRANQDGTTTWSSQVIANQGGTTERFFPLHNNIELYRDYAYGALLTVSASDYMNTTKRSTQPGENYADKYGDFKTFRDGTIRPLRKANTQYWDGMMSDAAENNQYLWYTPFAAYEPYNFAIKFYGH